MGPSPGLLKTPLLHEATFYYNEGQCNEALASLRASYPHVGFVKVEFKEKQ